MTKYAQHDIIIEPLGDKVLVQRRKVDELSMGGIIVPKNEISIFCDVLSVGPGRADNMGVVHAMNLKPGDIVIISPIIYGTEVELDREVYMLVEFSEILGVVRDNPAAVKN